MQLSYGLMLVLWMAGVSCCMAFNAHFQQNSNHRRFPRLRIPVASSGRQTLLPLQMAASSLPFDWKGTKKAAEEKMQKCVESIQTQFQTIRVGAANPTMLDRVMVECYGSMKQLQKISRISTNGPQQLVIEPFDKEHIKSVEKAIKTAELNLNPIVDGHVIRVNVPPLTEERRKDMAKQARSISEDGKVAIRNARRDFVEKIKQAEKSKAIGKDDSKTFQDDLQKVTDSFAKKIDDSLKAKEKDLLKV